MHKDLYMLRRWRYSWDDSGIWKVSFLSSRDSWIALMSGPVKPSEEGRPPFMMLLFLALCAALQTGLSTTQMKVLLVVDLSLVTYWLCKKILPEASRFQDQEIRNFEKG